MTQRQAMVHVDYLTGVFECATKDDMQGIIAQIWQYTGCDGNLDWRKPLYRGQYWEGSGGSPIGVKVAAQAPKEGAPGKLWISVPGKPLSSMSDAARRSFLRYCYAMEMRTTRIDIALDIPRDMVSKEQIGTALEYREVVGPRNYKAIAARERGRDSWSYYIGGAGSDVQLCIYDKWIESDGEIDALRWELRCRDERADVTLKYLMQYDQGEVDSWARAQASLITSWIDFRVALPGKRAQDREQLSWWREIQLMCKSDVWPEIKRAVKTLQQTLSWLQKQVIRTIEMIRTAAGPGNEAMVVDWLYEGYDSILRPDNRLKVSRWREEIIRGYMAPCAV
jgi:hypothetical protein